MSNCCCHYAAVNCREVLLAPRLAGSLPQLFPSSFLASSPSLSQSFSSNHATGRAIWRHKPALRKETELKITSGLKVEPLKVIISGAPGSGTGTLCEMIAQKFGLVHVSIGDILRAEVAAGTETGNRVKEYMNSIDLVPEEIITPMATARLSLQDVKEKGWVLDGYPQSLEQAQSLETLNIRPDVFIMLEVRDDILIDRCVGRRLDPFTGKIYHLKDSPPENEEIEARLSDFPDNTEDKVISRLQIYKKSAESFVSTYSRIMKKIDGNQPIEAVFKEIDYILSGLEVFRKEEVIPGESGRNDKELYNSSTENSWRGIPTRLNNIPHSREIRKYFYEDVLQATQRAVLNGKTRLKVEISIPELNPEMDVYRIGTLMELVRVLALSFAQDGKRVKVCVQGSMGEGALSGMPLQLSGSRKILEFMDWGDDGAIGTFIRFGSVGGKEVEEQDDMFIIVAPQNAVGNCIIDDLKAMTDAAAQRPVILVNPRLKDLPGSSGIMQTMGRDKRLEYAASFEICYLFRLLYYLGTQYPIMGALRMSYPNDYELYKRIDESAKKEKYVLLSKFARRPSGQEINDSFEGKSRGKAEDTGIWRFFSNLF